MVNEIRPKMENIVSEETISVLTQPIRKQQQRSIVTQQKLLDAAIEAFAENGFKGTSTRDIAERAGVHHPLITYHFKNKDQLWRAAANHIFIAFGQSLTQSMADSQGLNAKERMSRMVYAYVRYARHQPALHKVMVQESSYPSSRLDWLIEKHLNPLFQVVFGMITELQSLGVAPQGNPALLFNMIRLSSGGLLALGNELKASSGIDTNKSEVIDEIAEMVIRVFLPGDMPESS
jgi:AcrR family transcriptional regulator